MYSIRLNSKPLYTSRRNYVRTFKLDRIDILKHPCKSVLEFQDRMYKQADFNELGKRTYTIYIIIYVNIIYVYLFLKLKNTTDSNTIQQWRLLTPMYWHPHHKILIIVIYVL